MGARERRAARGPPLTRLKLTGLTRVEDAAAAAAVGVDVVGFVFYARSPRYVPAARVWEMDAVLPPGIQRHGVFVDTPPPLVQRVVDQLELDAAQLFGAEPRQDVESLSPHAYKAVTVATAAECEAAGRAFGTRRARRGDPGLLIHLTRLDPSTWRELAAIARKVPLAVGVPVADAAAIRRLVEAVRPWGIDVWEAVEHEPGRIDAARLADVAAAVRSASPRGAETATRRQRDGA